MLCCLAYPHNRQRYLRHPKSSLNIPVCSNTSHNRRRPPFPSHPRPNMKQFGQESECTPQSPPRGRHSAECTAHQQRHIPLAVNPQNDGDTRMQARRGGVIAVMMAMGALGRGGGRRRRDNSRLFGRRNRGFVSEIL